MLGSQVLQEPSPEDCKLADFIVDETDLGRLLHQEQAGTQVLTFGVTLGRASTKIVLTIGVILGSVSSGQTSVRRNGL